MFYVDAAGRMHGLKYGSCRFWQRTDLTPDSNKFRMVYVNAAGLLHGLKYGSCRFWQRNDLTPDSNKFRMVYVNAAGLISWRSNMLRLAYADSGSACKLAQDMVPTAHTQIEVRAQPLESSLGRVPQAADDSCNKIFANRIVSVAEDCLSPERTFHGCSLMHFRGCFRGSIPLPFPPRKITAASEARSQ